MHNLFLASILIGLTPLLSQARQAPQASEATNWNCPSAKHVYGLPGAKANKGGSLQITATELSFLSGAANAVIPLQSVLAASTASERVELWGTKGRILRMVIPDGGGLAAATVMHHKIDMLTVEFSDNSGGYHGAVFVLPASDAETALQKLAKAGPAPSQRQPNSCEAKPAKAASVLLALPDWNQVAVPAAYRALVYEHTIERLRKMNGIDRVYRDGEADAQAECPQFTLQLTLNNFKPGSQVRRASMGPVGLFVASTQMEFDLHIADAGANQDFHETFKATQRGDTENASVTGLVAGQVVKHFKAARKKAATGTPAQATGAGHAGF